MNYPVIQGLPKTEDREVVRKIKQLTERPVGINLEPLEQGKEIFAVPGNIDSPASMGTNRMIRDGMFPVFEADDVLIRMRWGRQIHTNKPAPAWELTEDEQCVYEQLEQGDLSYDALAGYTGQSDAQLSTCLTLMEIRGIIKQLPGRIYTIVRS